MDGGASGSDFLGRKLKERRRWGGEGKDGGLECRMHPRRRNLDELFMLLEDRDASDGPGQRIMADPFLEIAVEDGIFSDVLNGVGVPYIHRKLPRFSDRMGRNEESNVFVSLVSSNHTIDSLLMRCKNIRTLRTYRFVEMPC